ncbi:MAG: hypothetical protein ACI4RS_06715, partial [Monoglobaceae bacterium]
IGLGNRMGIGQLFIKIILRLNRQIQNNFFIAIGLGNRMGIGQLFIKIILDLQYNVSVRFSRYIKV